MKGLTDKEYITMILDEQKLAASAYTTLVLESSNQFLRNDATNLLNKTFQHQKQIFDLMSQKGWYNVQNASTQDVSRVQQEVNSIKTSGMS